MKQPVIIFIVMSIVIGLVATMIITRHKKERLPAIGIAQTASHPALDRVYQGFIDRFKERAENRFSFVYQNAQGSVMQAQSVAQSLHADSAVKAILTIATPTTQAVIHKEKEKPIVFTAVTDARLLGIPGSGQEAHKHQDRSQIILGIEDRVQTAKMLELVQHLLAQIIKKKEKQTGTVTLLYNPSEINSLTMAQEFESALKQAGVIVKHCGIYQEQDIVPAVTSACRSCDLLLAPTDNMVAVAASRIAEIATKATVPFVVSDLLLLDVGATAACGIDYYLSGKMAADLMYDLVTRAGQNNNDRLGALSPLPTTATQQASTVAYNHARMKLLALEESA